MITDLCIPGRETSGRANSVLWWGWRSLQSDRAWLQTRPAFTVANYRSSLGVLRIWVPRPVVRAGDALRLLRAKDRLRL